MTVTAEQAKAMLDDRAPMTRLINLAYEGGLLVELDIEARHHANSVQQLAATVVELYERLAENQEWINAQGAEMAKLYDAYGMVEAERDQLREDLGLANEVIETLEEQVSNARIAGRGIEIQRDKLARWKAEAMTVLAGWNQLWEDAGRPGALGDSTSAATAKHITVLQAAIHKVLALHTKTTEEMLDNKCANEVCEHEDECPSILVDVCGCCAAIAQQVSDEYWPASMDEITWPCPTVAALTQGGEG